MTKRLLHMLKPFYLDLNSSEIEDIEKRFGRILREGTLILGENTEDFECEFSKYVGTAHAVAVNSGTSALEISLSWAGTRGRKIAVPTNTNFASVAAIIKCGGTPVFMDMDEKYFLPNLDILKVTNEKNTGLSGVLWVHIGGIISPDFEKIVEYCRAKKLFLIEDAAHAHGSQFKGIKAGALGDSGCFSFFPTKVMTTIEGGMITTNDLNEARFAKSMRNQGKRDGNFGGLHYDLGSSYRMSEISAYIGLIQLQRLDKMVGTRQIAVDRLVTALDRLGIDYCCTSHMDQASHYKFIIRPDRDVKTSHIKEKFQEDGIVLGGGVYETPCHLQPVFSYLAGGENNSLQVAEKFCPNQICPPITSGTKTQDIDRIIESIKRHIC